MARPLVAQIDLAAMRVQPRARPARWRPARRVLAVVKANAYGHGLARVLPALADADGLALIELDAAVAPARCRITARPILLLEGFFDAARARRDRRALASRSSCTTPSSCGCSRRARLARAARELVVKVNTGMNRLGFAPREVAGVCERLEATGDRSRRCA